jgi:hypothetical protein
VDAATKAGLLDLLEEAFDAGVDAAPVCHELELPERRVHRWIGRRGCGRFADRASGGGHRCTGCPRMRWPRSAAASVLV